MSKSCEKRVVRERMAYEVDLEESSVRDGGGDCGPGCGQPPRAKPLTSAVG